MALIREAGYLTYTGLTQPKSDHDDDDATTDSIEVLIAHVSTKHAVLSYTNFQKDGLLK